MPEGNQPTAAKSFTDAAEIILSQAESPLHYREITKRALEHGLVTSSGSTPEASMNAQIGVDIDKRHSRGEQPRFVRLGHGMIGLAEDKPHGLVAAIEHQNKEVRESLAKQLRSMPAEHFERLIGRLLGELGFDDVQVTSYSHDGGIDVRGTLVVGDVIRVHMAVQAKRWSRNVQTPTVHEVRGSLGSHDAGLIITTSDFSSGAREEAAAPNKISIALMNGEQLVALLAQHQIGVKRTEASLLELSGLAGDEDD